MFYAFCKIKGHTRENYFKIVGYPQDYKIKKKEGNNSAYNVVTEPDNPMKSVDTMQVSQGSSSHGTTSSR